MKIGVDIDGVLTNEHDFRIEVGIKYCIENGIEYSPDPSKFVEGEILGLRGKDSDEFQIGFDNKYREWYAREWPPRPFVSEVMKKLKGDGHEIYIITARAWSWEETEQGERMRKTVKEWFAKHGIPYDEIIFTNEGKPKVCLENDIDLIIEDKPTNVANCAKVIPWAIVFDNESNGEVRGENIFRCYGWYDIYKTISKIA